MRPKFYCKSWFRAKKRPTEIWTEEYARAAHSSNKLYTVLIDSLDRPFCFLEINKGFVGVGFLDEMVREYLYYAFKEIEPGKLFLHMATHREFQGDTNTVVEGTTYNFDSDGSTRIQKQNFKLKTTAVANSSVDVAANYSNWPEFGDYDDLVRINR